MSEKEEKARKKMIVEEIAETNKIEVPLATQPHIEPGIHEEPVKEEPTIPVSPIPVTATGPNPLVIIIPGIFLLGALLGGIIFYQNKVSGRIQNTEPSPIETVTENPSPTPTPRSAEVDLTKYSVNILNGSGIKGEAGKVQDLLEAAGFKIKGTGNASNYNYKETVIQAKSEVSEEFITELKKALTKTYKVAAKTQSLTDSSPDFVIVIVGSSKN